ncbi:aminotransferase class IV [Fulvivirga aurantia]|uniref:aminotransferase class IV n=1 Tax=Fulvivirga aurantia TaxID=2529383 RepID=UPI00162626DA|nr:aminotransferase class IV [Fulvivirga aurantia]
MLKEEDASLGIRDLALLRGYGIFDFFRLSKGVPLFIDDHLDRFYAAAEKVRLDVPYTQQELKSRIGELLNLNEMPISGVRLLLTGGYTPDGFDPGHPNLVVTQEPISFPSTEKYTHGIKLITYEHLREMAHVKTINYMTGVWLRKKVIEENAYDVIYTYQNKVLELTRSNVFIVDSDNKIVTPKENVLMGITRKNLIRAIEADGGYTIEERDVSVNELVEAKEAFLTGTTKKVLPITQIDDKKIGGGQVGKVTNKMMTLFKKTESDYVESHE